MTKKMSPDDFWDLKDLVPVKKSPKPAPLRKITNTKIEITKTVKSENKTPYSDNKLSPEVLKNKVLPPKILSSYENEESFIKKVTVYNWSTQYNYYDLFCKQARYYRTLTPHECTHEHFFSYLPQFSQMTPKQIGWYLWWKHKSEQKVFLDTDCTYILLYAFELINLSTGKDAQDALNIMIDLWANYRGIYPQLDVYLGEWICDFALVHRLSIKFPDPRISKEMIEKTSIPEIFYTFDFNNVDLFSKFLLSYCNSYNYRKSKFYDEKTKPFFEKHIPESLALVIKNTAIGNTLLSKCEKSISKNTYMGALCSYDAKKKIEVSYVSLSLENDLKKSVSNIIKYAENLIRSYLGCRSRLGVKDIEPTVKSILDNYFSLNLKKEAYKFAEPEYEKLYERKFEALSPEKANEIETDSWNITEKLVEAFDDDIIETDTQPLVTSLPPEIKEDVDDQQNAPLSDFYSRIVLYKDLFELICIENYSGQIKYAKENKIMLEAAVDVINEAAADVFGDILVEEFEIGYRIIEEYKDLIK